MKQQETFATAVEPSSELHSAFLLGRAAGIIDMLVNRPDAISMEFAREFLADYEKWLDRS